MEQTLDAESIVVVAQDQTSSHMGEEVIILGLREGTYYGLDGVGRTVWDSIQQPQTVRAVCEAVCMRYDVDPRRCRRDVMLLLQNLVNEGLVVRVPATDARPHPHP